MATQTNLKRLFGFSMVATVAVAGAVTVAGLGSAGCDALDDIATDILTKNDAGAGSDGGGSAPAPVCKTDSDCRVFSDYCTGCDCRALGVKEADPVCGGRGVMCLVDPCRDKTATCASGKCVIGPPAPVACLSSVDCGATAFCTTETGTCNRPPGCAPDAICPAVCYGTCQARPTTGPACGPKTCAAGEVCCNKSCGICTPPGGACTQQFCG